MTPPSLTETKTLQGSSDALALEGVRICVDQRRPAHPNSLGVATYSAALDQTLRRIGARVEYLTNVGSVPQRPPSRRRRWSAAIGRNQRWLDEEISETGPLFLREDIFREAQVHFNIYGRLLPIQSKNPPDVMHWTYPLPMIMSGAKNIYTIHDAIPLEYPNLTNISRRRHLRLLKRICETADHIVTVSEHSRAALIRLLDCPPDLVNNTYQARLVESSAPPSLPPGLTADGYLLYCGSIEPRKNIRRLVAAHRLSGVDLPLVIAGPDGWRARQELPQTLLGEPGLIRLPRLQRPVLTTLIREAKALLFPSLAEGFGLPVLEAMALGVPVMTSNRGALAEIAGDGAITTPPDDIEAMAWAIRRLSQDKSLRTALRAAGRRRAMHFSGELYARRLAETYRQALNLRGETPAPTPPAT